jgi:hypothetical protein
MDVRGRGDSDGEFQPYVNEGRDGFDAVEWAAAQPWSSGDVALWGWSYFAASAWLTALEQPPSLRAFVANGAPGDPFTEFPTGTWSPMYCCWHRIVDGRLTQYIEAVDWGAVYEHLPLLTMDERAGFHGRWWREHLAHPTLDDYWAPLCYQGRFAEIDLPVLHVTGWYDDTHLSSFVNFAGMVREAPTDSARRGQALLVGPWYHDQLPASGLAGLDLGPDAPLDVDAFEVEWLDAVLSGSVDGPRAHLFVMGANEWRDESAWPVARTEWTEWFLRSGGNARSSAGDGRLTREPPAAAAAEPPDAYLHDPANPVPLLTDEVSLQIGGPDDYAEIERRDDVLVYTADPFEVPVDVIGPVELTLFASSSAVDTDFMAKLVRLRPDGFAQRLCDGMVRGRFREGFEREVFLEPGRVYELRIDLWATAQRFEPGERLRLEIASSAFPKYDRNAGTGGPLATETRLTTATNTVWHTHERPSRLLVPIVPLA